jgi:hypothetical protein
VVNLNNNPLNTGNDWAMRALGQALWMIFPKTKIASRGESPENLFFQLI